MIASIEPYSLARIIRRFFHMKMVQHKEKTSKEKLQKLFKDDVKYQLVHIMEKAAKLLKLKSFFSPVLPVSCEKK